MLDRELHPEARREAIHALEYLWVHGGDVVASKFTVELLEAIKLCSSPPLLYRTFHKNVRRIILHKPFTEYYEAFVVLDEKIYILAIAHANRKPFYWRKRLQDIWSDLVNTE